MSGMDGATVGRTIKGDERLKNTHLVLLSSRAKRGDAMLYKKAGFVPQTQIQNLVVDGFTEVLMRKELANK